MQTRFEFETDEQWADRQKIIKPATKSGTAGRHRISDFELRIAVIQSRCEMVARIRALVGRSAPTSAKLDLNEMIQELLAIISAEARREVILVRTELAAGLPPVRGDRVQLRQVILNLVMNGIEAMKEVADRPR